MERANERGLEVIDGTCTWVIQEHKELTKLVEEGYTIVLLGTPNHPEVVGLLGFAPDAIVVDEEEEWEQKIPRKKRMALISQSTQPPWKFEKLAAFMVSRSHELKIVNTVCPVTIRRQEDTRRGGPRGRPDGRRRRPIERQHQGADAARAASPASPRSRSRAAATSTDAAVFDGRRIVGVTGGTSTPIEDLRDVARRVLEIAGTPGRRRSRRRAGPGGACRRRARRRPHHVAPERRPTAALDQPWPPSEPAGCLSSPSSAGPNVGKSTLFNRIVGQRQAIVEDRARTTRDRMYGDAEWNGRRFIIVDTGGLEVDPADPIELKVQEQARLAIREADVILFLVDAASGLTPADEEAAELLRRSTKPVIVAAEQGRQPGRARSTRPSSTRSAGTRPTRSPRRTAAAPATCSTRSSGRCRRRPRRSAPARPASTKPTTGPRDVAAGRLEPFVVEDEEADEDDAADGVDVAPDATEARWDAAIAAATEDDEPAAIAFVGRPNVGKSSLLNALLGEDRAIVSEIPGTTRDAIDTTLEWGRSEIVLIDTAGIRRRGKVASGPAAERFSTLRALKAIGRADVAVLVIDAVDGLTAQDAHVAGYVVEEGRGLVVAVNKWDLVEEKTDRTFDQYVEWIRNQTPFLDFAPIVSISAKTGQRVGKVLELAIDIWGERRKRIPTARAEPRAPGGHGSPAATGRQGPPAEDLLRHPGRRRAADVRVLRQRRRVGPLQLPPLPREPDPRRVRVPRHADQADLPRPRLGQAAAPAQEGDRTAVQASREPDEPSREAVGRRWPLDAARAVRPILVVLDDAPTPRPSCRTRPRTPPRSSRESPPIDAAPPSLPMNTSTRPCRAGLRSSSCCAATALHVGPLVRRIHEAGKLVAVHVDLVGGIRADRASVAWLADCRRRRRDQLARPAHGADPPRGHDRDPPPAPHAAQPARYRARGDRPVGSEHRGDPAGRDPAVGRRASCRTSDVPVLAGGFVRTEDDVAAVLVGRRARRDDELAGAVGLRMINRSRTARHVSRRC